MILTQTKYDFDTVFKRFPRDIQDKINSIKQFEGHHPEIYLKEHMRQVFNLAQDVGHPVLMIAALLHDLGKIDTQRTYYHPKYKKMVTCFIGHERYAPIYIRRYIHLFRDILPADGSVYDVGYICKHHMRIHKYLSGEMTDRKKRLRLEAHPCFNLLIKFAEIDKLGRQPLLKAKKDAII